MEDFVFVEGGTFNMGAQNSSELSLNFDSDAYLNESPIHQVILSDYYISKFEVTQELWEEVMGFNPSVFKGSNLPVENISWDNIQEFIRNLNNLTGHIFRLPTEAEWEYAARGGKMNHQFKYSGSNSIDQVAWYNNNSDSKTHPVGTKQPNGLGLFDMNGNVGELCQDWYGGYSNSSQSNPLGPSNGVSRVLRGGGWSYEARYCRVFHRIDIYPYYHNYTIGFRLILVQ